MVAKGGVEVEAAKGKKSVDGKIRVAAVVRRGERRVERNVQVQIAGQVREEEQVLVQVGGLIAHGGAQVEPEARAKKEV